MNRPILNWLKSEFVYFYILSQYMCIIVGIKIYKYLYSGLKRCGKSCRLRWLNYLRPDIKHGGFTEEEDHIILTLYNKIGSRQADPLTLY